MFGRTALPSPLPPALEEIADLLQKCSEFLAKAADLMPAREAMLKHGGVGARSAIEDMAAATHNLGRSMRVAAEKERRS